MAQNVIANVADLVDRMQELENNKSHIGMIIESVGLDTMEKVIAIYGGITWTRIEGKMLLGTSSNHNINETGGEESHTLTTNEMPSHSHTFTGINTSTGTESANHTHAGSTNSDGDHGHYFNSVVGPSASQYTTPSCPPNGKYAALNLGTAVTNNGSSISNSGTHKHTFSTAIESVAHYHNVTAQGTNSSAGNGYSHNNMPPYMTVYIWKRTA